MSTLPNVRQVVRPWTFLWPRPSGTTIKKIKASADGRIIPMNANQGEAKKRKAAPNKPPKDAPEIEFEQVILGGLITRSQLEPEEFPKVAGLLMPEDFYREAHAIIYRAMIDLRLRGKPVDLVSVIEILRERGELDKVGGAMFLMRLTDEVGYAVNVGYYVEKVRERADLRRIRNLALRLAEASDDSGRGKSGETVAELISQLTVQHRVAAPFNPITAKDLKGVEFPPRRWAVPDLITEGLTILAGRPKVGKSYLILNISAAIAAGGLALGKIEVEQGEVLYLGLEDSKRRLQERLKKIMPPDTLWPESLFLEAIGGLPKLNQGGLAILDAWLKKYPGVKLVVVDTLAKVKPGKGRHEDAYQHDAAIIGDLQKLAFEHGVALILVHHTNKRQTDDIVEEVSGTYGLTGAADCVAVLSRKARGQMDGSLKLTGRDQEDQDLALKFDPDLGLWDLIGETRKVMRSKEREAIMDILQRYGPLTYKEIAAHLEKNPNNINALLYKMKDAGEVRQSGDKYILPL
jgi:hypothetical protein